MPKNRQAIDVILLFSITYADALNHPPFIIINNNENLEHSMP